MFKCRLRTSFVALLFAALAGLSAQAASLQRLTSAENGTGYSIAGQIIVPTPGFWDYIEVILEYETGVSTYMHTSGAGAFSFSNLQAGKYYVLVELDGFEPVRERIDVIADAGLQLRHMIYLVPEGTSKTADVERRKKFPKKAVEEYEKGRDEFKKGDLPKAVQRLSAALKDEPMFFDAQLLLGTVYYKMRQIPEAEGAYHKARLLDAKAVQPLMNLGQIYIEAADSSVDRDPVAAANVYKAAYKLLTEAASLDPKSATVVFLLGVSCYKSARNDEAESNLKRALELNSRLGQAQVMLANVYIRKQNWQEALKTLDAYLKDHGNAPDAKLIQETRAKVADRVKGGGK